LFLHTPCDHHDFNYWLGGTEADRWKADWQLCQEGLKRAKWNPLKISAVMVYYSAVMSCGWICFHYGKERDMDDLEALTLKSI
jgi:hypothetical protein